MQIIKLLLAAAFFGAATVTSAPMGVREIESEAGPDYKRDWASDYIDADYKRDANVEADYKRDATSDFIEADYKRDANVEADYKRGVKVDY